ncbi:MAG: hypothetical protein IJX34_02655 [Clostridia bacterium]|nr:hypothetical protein [Clostridia bacterium]
MKSKITLVILLAIILFLGALSLFFGYYYFKTEGELETLTGIVNELTKVPEDTTGIEVEEPVEKIAIAKFDSTKLDNSARTSVVNPEESAYTVSLGDITYRKGPKKSITSSSIYELDYQIKYKTQTYTLSETANILDVRGQHAGVSSRNYIIILMDDGTIKYSLVEYESTTLEFKDYSEIKDAVALVNLGTTNGKPQVSVGVITSDGVTHILPYEMP